MKIRKSAGITLALFVYITASAAYLLPRNTEISVTEKFLTLAVAYVILVLLWLVLRKKEELQRKRREEEERYKKDIH